MKVNSRRRSILAAAVFLFAPLTTPAWGQNHVMQYLLSGKNYPLGIKLKDLNTDWRRLVVQSALKISDNVSVNVSGSTHGSTSQNNLIGSLAGGRAYVTKGQVVSAAGREYLVAYHLPGGALDLGVLVQSLLTKSPPTNAVLTGDTVLPLSLLDLGTVGSLEDVRVFDLESELAESARAAQSLGKLFKSEKDGNSAKPGPAAEEDPEK